MIKGAIYEGDELTGIGLMNKPLKNVEVTQPSNPSKPKAFSDSSGNFELNSTDYKSPIELKLSNYSAPFGKKAVYDMSEQDAEFMNYYLYPTKKQDAPKEQPKVEQIVQTQKKGGNEKKLTQKQKNILSASFGGAMILASILLLIKQK